MTTHVAAMLDAGAREDARRLRMLKLALLSEYFASEPILADGYRRFSAVLDGHPANEVLDRGTTFFWKSVHVCCIEAVLAGGRFTAAANYLLRCAWDAYFDWIPDGWTLTLPPVDSAELVLPRLGLLIPSRGEPLVLTRRSASTLEVQVGKRSIGIDLLHPDSLFVLPRFPIPGVPRAGLVLIKDASLFDEPYRDRLTPDIENAAVLTELIGRSLALIRAADPGLGTRMDGMVEWYFPIDSPDRMTHNSFSVRFLFGSLFLSAAYEDLRLAEAIVHEFHHNELYLAQEAVQFTKFHQDDIFYSPFRPDPRPLDGLLHALFVFTGVANFIAQVEQLPEMADSVRGLRHRRQEVVNQLRLGLVQVPRERLTAAGEELIRLIEVDIARHETEVGSIGARMPEALAAHLSHWHSVNVNYRHVVRLPSGVEAA